MRNGARQATALRRALLDSRRSVRDNAGELPERCPRGRRSALGKRVGGSQTVSRVRIPASPPSELSPLLSRTYDFRWSSCTSATRPFCDRLTRTRSPASPTAMVWETGTGRPVSVLPPNLVVESPAHCPAGCRWECCDREPAPLPCRQSRGCGGSSSLLLTRRPSLRTE